MFFCGHQPHCGVFGDERALMDAKANVEKHFSVVGILEDMQDSLKVLEKFVPAFFEGVPQLYKNRRRKKVNDNNFK